MFRLRHPSIILLFGFYLLCNPVNTFAADLLLSDKQYTDPKGYFKIIPPNGWRIQEYPNDPRGKVAFIGPAANIDLRVLVNSVDFTSINDLISFCKDVEKKIGTNTNIDKVDFVGKPAVKRSFEFKGVRLLYYDFLIGKVDHNIGYSAPPSLFNKFLPIVKTSMETYEPILKSLSAVEEKQHLIAKKKHLSELMILTKNYEMAIQYAEEGLAIEHNNKELQSLRDKAKSLIK